ncbi:MAG: hypothetical protein QME85_07025 [Candidatus Saccharicenans sp.]|nr:hypothetical protein [Candidatus Saccharicenans sp.]MDI6848776.1 hypothetical protein [Candidatus Saccharicenans sp.]
MRKAGTGNYSLELTSFASGLQAGLAIGGCQQHLKQGIMLDVPE